MSVNLYSSRAASRTLLAATTQRQRHENNLTQQPITHRYQILQPWNGRLQSKNKTYTINIDECLQYFALNGITATAVETLAAPFVKKDRTKHVSFYRRV